MLVVWTKKAKSLRRHTLQFLQHGIYRTWNMRKIKRYSKVSLTLFVVIFLKFCNTLLIPLTNNVFFPQQPHDTIHKGIHFMTFSHNSRIDHYAEYVQTDDDGRKT